MLMAYQTDTANRMKRCGVFMESNRKGVLDLISRRCTAPVTLEHWGMCRGFPTHIERKFVMSGPCLDPHNPDQGGRVWANLDEPE